ncbi:hypothetical protein DFS34DRAFT_607125, partial [Phlyctochytrium arcticum]
MTGTPPTTPLVSQRAAMDTAVLTDRLEELRLEKMRKRFCLIRESIMPETRFKGKIGNTDMRTLKDFEAEIARAFEEQGLDLQNNDPEFQQGVLLLMRNFLHPEGKAFEMYKQCISRWRHYDCFIKELNLRFLNPYSGAALIAEWEASAQGSKTFLEWKSELDRLWETVGMHMGRHLYITKIKEKAHPEVISKMGSRLHRLPEADLVDEM